MRAVVFSLSDQQSQQFLAAPNDRELRLLAEELEECWERQHLVELDKAWDAIERCLTILGVGRPFSDAKQLHRGRDCVLALLSPTDLGSMQPKLTNVSRGGFREAFSQMLSGDYEGPGDEDDLEYSWSYFQALRQFYHRADSEGRSTLFSVNL